MSAGDYPARVHVGVDGTTCEVVVRLPRAALSRAVAGPAPCAPLLHGPAGVVVDVDAGTLFIGFDMNDVSGAAFARRCNEAYSAIVRDLRVQADSLGCVKLEDVSPAARRAMRMAEHLALAAAVAFRDLDKP